MFIISLYKKYLAKKVVSYIRNNANVSNTAVIHPTASVKLIHGAKPSNIVIEENAKIYGALNSCADGKIFIGKFVHLGPGSKICCVNKYI